jgi:hypothetical protein
MLAQQILVTLFALSSVLALPVAPNNEKPKPELFKCSDKDDKLSVSRVSLDSRGCVTGFVALCGDEEIEVCNVKDKTTRAGLVMFTPKSACIGIDETIMEDDDQDQSVPQLFVLCKDGVVLQISISDPKEDEDEVE